MNNIITKTSMTTTREDMMENKDKKWIQKEYAKLRAKHKLPEYEEINHTFEIEHIEQTSFLAREILRTMHDHLDKYVKLLEELLQADSHLAGLFESSHITEEQKKRWYDIYRGLMHLNRASIAVFTRGDEKEEAATILKVWKAWQELREEFIELGEFLADTWTHDEADLPTEKQRYLG